MRKALETFLTNRYTKSINQVHMKQKSKVRESSEYAKVLVFQWFFLLERLPLMDARAAINGIQEVSGSIPLISTKNVENHWFQHLFFFSAFSGGFSNRLNSLQI